MTDEIMYELMQLTGQEYVDIYANKAKDLIARHGTSTPTPEQVAAASGGAPAKKKGPRPGGGR